jgi:hypothetical protein
MTLEAKDAPAAEGAGVVLLTLAAGQFLMVLDSSVMNVSNATVANDLHTTITGIQSAIVLCTPAMAMRWPRAAGWARSSAASARSRSGS